jgi:hypothetical protein
MPVDVTRFLISSQTFRESQARLTATLRTMIDYIHNNPVRRALVDHSTDWPWSSAQFYPGTKDVALIMDPLVEFVGLA